MGPPLYSWVESVLVVTVIGTRMVDAIPYTIFLLCYSVRYTITPSNRTNKRGARRVRQNKSPVKVISMTQTEAYEAKLSRGMDTVVLHGKLALTTAANVTPVSVNPITPFTVGQRAAAMAGIFSRYRFKSIRVKFMGASVGTGLSATGIVALGFQDDISITAANPANFQDVSELRCSATSFAAETVPTYFEWTPVDKNLWYYTTNDLTESRLSTSAVLWAAGTPAATADIELDYTLVFQGAIDPLAN
jgi:hypothetical protein